MTATLQRTVALVGLMGAGKTAIGRRLARALSVPFRDADEAIEAELGLSVSDIFAHHGEAYFREVERRVVARLLAEPPHVLATGGGAFINEATRALIKERAVSVWLKADLDLLMRRVAGRTTRPLLAAGDPEAVMRKLMAGRYPIYAQADITVESVDGPHERVVEAVLKALEAFETQQARHA